jgi:hypothetical protein
MALACDTRGNGQIVGVDQCTVAELLAVSPLGGWWTEVVMVAQGRGERTGETRALDGTQGAWMSQTLGGLEATGFDRFTQCQELGCSVPYQGHEDAPLPSTTAAKAPHDVLQLLGERLGLAPKDRGAAAGLLRARCDERKGFLCAFYRVVASVPR